MTRILRRTIDFLLVLLVLQAIPARAGKRMSPELLWKLGRLGSAAASADGNRVAYVVRRYELKENRGTSTLYVRAIDSNAPRKLLSAPFIASVQWARTPRGERIYYVAPAGKKKEPQAFVLDPAKGNPQQVTAIPGGIGNLKVSPTGKHIAFTLDVKMDPTVRDLYPDLPKADARIIDQLMYRHWDTWHDYKYRHVHIAPIDANGKAGKPVDLMEGRRADCPVPPFGGSEQFAWSPDGRELALTMKLVRNWAESTDSDVYLVSIETPRRFECISVGMEGYDNDPVYSPDGRWIAFHSMRRPGFEADRNRIMLYDRSSGAVSELTRGLDQAVHGARWSPDSDSMLFMSEWRGTNQLFEISLKDHRVVQWTHGRYNWNLVSVLGAERLLVTRQSMLRPNELGVWNRAHGKASMLTDINGAIYRTLELPRIEERWTRATDGKRIHSWVIYPPDFDPQKRWPMLTYCQGGPQGQIGQWFSFRWNFHLMAAQGYVVVAVNRRGLPGFGRAWNDQISGDWGGQAMQDILAATDDMLTEAYVDPQRVGAIGASFGGYTVYWLMGNHAGRFCTMVAHAGVFNLESMYGSTEELFFVNWDLGGPYWSSRRVQARYNRFSPHRYVGNWKTPLLVIHGEKDFRVPVTQGMEAFTAAQVKGIPSRFLYFPHEGHWVLSPQNGVLWHRIFFDWLDRYCKDR